MKQEIDDYEDHNENLPIIYMTIGVSLFILLVMGIVIAKNKKPDHKPTPVIEESSNLEEVSSHSKLTASDLDIWDMYPEETSEETVIDDHKEETGQTEKEEDATEKNKDEKKFIYLEYADGSTEEVPINPTLKKNHYDFTNFISHNERPSYYSNGNQISSLGASISRYQKDVDFYQMKQDGIDFVMLRVGARGYKTGELQLDDTFDDHIQKATDAGLEIGLTVYSQAVTEEEAIAEAELILNHIGDYTIHYPIGIIMEFVPNDSSRIETLTREERTTITAAFVNKIKEANRTPIIYGNKEWLIKRIDLTKFSDCCIWLAEEDDFPHYPYEYAMWQYTTKGEVKGVSGYVDLSISFIDYSAR